jgi:hypothetical protein
MVVRAKEEFSIDVTEYANRVGCMHFDVPARAGVEAGGARTKLAG